VKPHSTRTGYFVYNPVMGLSYSVVPNKTYRRYVEFSADVTKQVEVCALKECAVCKDRA
jgi:hypothetical protein